MSEKYSNLEIKLPGWVIIAALAILAASLTAGATLFVASGKIVKQQAKVASEASRPANLQIVLITAQDCPDCYPVDNIITLLKKENVKIDSEQTVDRASRAADDLIKQYKIERLPTFIIKGEVTKDKKLNDILARLGVIENGVFVFKKVGGPYFDVASGQVKGRVELALITDPSCANCYDVTDHESILRQFGIAPGSSVVTVSSAEGQAILKKYAIIIH